jgi:hypothetical protein
MAAARPLTDSPWFWAYLFGTAALVALAIANPKFNVRQAQIEREYQGRLRAAQNLTGQEPSVEMSAAGNTIIGLRPLFIGQAAIKVIDWIIFLRSRHATRLGALPGDTSLALPNPEP